MSWEVHLGGTMLQQVGAPVNATLRKYSWTATVENARKSLVISAPFVAFLVIRHNASPECGNEQNASSKKV